MRTGDAKSLACLVFLSASHISHTCDHKKTLQNYAKGNASWYYSSNGYCPVSVSYQASQAQRPRTSNGSGGSASGALGSRRECNWCSAAFAKPFCMALPSPAVAGGGGSRSISSASSPSRSSTKTKMPPPPAYRSDGRPFFPIGGGAPFAPLVATGRTG